MTHHLSLASLLSLVLAVGVVAAEPAKPAVPATSSAPVAAKPAAVDHAGSLKAAIMKLEASMRDPSATVRKQGYLEMCPTKADLQILFSKYAEELWPSFDCSRNETPSDIDKFAKEWNKVQTDSFKLFDVRKEDPLKEYEAILKILPKEVPVFQVDRYGKASRTGTGDYAYLYANGHWFFIRGLEDAPKYLVELDKRRKLADQPPKPGQ
jgi:hypothetical protein